MSDNTDLIARFRKMASDDPDNELGHYRLGDELRKAGQFAEAVDSFRRTLELSPQFSKVYQLLGECLLALGQRDEAIATWRKGFEVADERGDNMPREAMAKLIEEQGETPPVSKRGSSTGGVVGGRGTDVAGVGGFRCQRPTCMAGVTVRQLDKPPFNDELGQRIYTSICATCWNAWLRDYSVKVINELRLDLSTDHGEQEYERYMREFLGLE
ncbi:MAG: Fe(2+)-trafficking protein [Gemmataceae bacterium]